MRPTEEPTAAHLLIKGIVQGVGYRYFVQRSAKTLGLTGWVRNLSNGAVEAEAEGQRAKIERWIEILREGPALARVDAVQINWLPYNPGHGDFDIVG